MPQNVTHIFDGLNESQKRAVTTTAGPLLVIAGPGTGKTLTIVRRIAYLVHQGVRPENILAVTFTNRAAREMKERTRALLGEVVSKLFIGTFHLLGLRMIKESRRDDFVLYNRDEQVGILKSLMQDSGKQAQHTAEKISRIKNIITVPDAETRDIFETYQSELQKKNAYDLDDLIHIPMQMLENDGETKNRYQDRFTYIIVDEYQDINPAQYRLLRLLAGSVCNVCAVGDSDQAIYAFRGADLRNFLDFEKDFPGAVKIALTENYRSTDVILKAADSVIKNNKKRIEKELVPLRDNGADVTVISVPDERAEGDAIIHEIEERMGGTSRYQQMRNGLGRGYGEQSSRFSDFGVFFRTNAQSKALEDAFAASGIPYQVVGRTSSAQAKEIEETLAYLRSLSHADKVTEPNPNDALEVKLLGPVDFFNPGADAVMLMTLHMAKGLEFPVVFMTGCEDGLIPCTLLKDGTDIEEERRLFYVGMTRTKNELILLHARNRFLYGKRTSPSSSPFLAEIPGMIVQCTVVPDKVKKKKEPDRQMELFKNT